jgi:hypothetical protein
LELFIRLFWVHLSAYLVLLVEGIQFHLELLTFSNFLIESTSDCLESISGIIPLLH